MKVSDRKFENSLLTENNQLAELIATGCHEGQWYEWVPKKIVQLYGSRSNSDQ